MIEFAFINVLMDNGGIGQQKDVFLCVQMEHMVKITQILVLRFVQLGHILMISCTFAYKIAQPREINTQIPRQIDAFKYVQ